MRGDALGECVRGMLDVEVSFDSGQVELSIAGAGSDSMAASFVVLG